MKRLECIPNEIDTAQRFLIKARIWRQRETMLRDRLANGWFYLGPELLLYANERACWYRAYVKSSLQMIERTLGKEYSRRGSVPYSLKDVLRGSEFRTWDCYAPSYDDEACFQGVDPE